MKNLYKTFLATSLILLNFSAKTQVSMYTFSQFSGTYNSISGGTVFATSTTDDGAFCNPSAPGTNNATGPGIPIGFPFTFNAVVYDVFGIDNNGWIAFGQSTLTPNPVNLNNSNLGLGISGTSTAPPILQNRVCAFGRDLVGNGGSLRVETVGSAPNRECVIQWSNYRVYLGSDNLYFQIRLKESTNQIDIVYGACVVTGNNAAQVGIRGDSNADFSNRSVVSPNVWATSIPGTVNTDVCNVNTSGLIPANGQVYEWNPPVPCSGAPASNTATSVFSTICPNGGTNLNLINTYSNSGISYQWYVSDASAVGPFTLIPSGTTPIYGVTNVTVTSWYQAVITCSVGPMSSTSTPVNVIVAGTTTNSVPYHEGFEGIVSNNQLPNCSWSASSPTTINQTYVSASANNRIPHTGSKFASFRYGTSSTGDYFYSNGVQLEPGITYSAAVWYITDGNVGWSELSMHYGTSQTSTGLTAIASLTGAVTGQFYQLLSNTFSVPTSGLYYIAIKCIGSSSPQYLTFDDLSVTIPCSLNSPTMNLVTTPSVVCIGQPVTISASGANSYSWSTGQQTPMITFTPFSNMNIDVIGTNALSGCSTTLSQSFNPNASPVISIFSNSQSVCMGSTATLYAFGADTYTWTTGSFAPSATIAPTASTTYSVLGSNAIGCIGSTAYLVNVLNPPVISATNSHGTEMCVNETATLTANGALNYQWKSNTTIVLTQVAYVSPKATTVYTLTGTDVNGCSTTTQVAISVSECTGLNENTAGLHNINVYPNPATNDFTVELKNGMNKQIQLIDVTGRVVMTGSSKDDKLNVKIGELASGIYYVKVSSGNESEIIKLIKN